VGRLSGALAALVVAGALGAQTLEIHSEFQRVDPYGEIVAADRAALPREILSPAVARNAWASFHVVVTAPRGTSYLLYVATNPLNACRVALYKEHFAKTPTGWIPDALTEIGRLPDFGVLPDPDDGVAGQTTRDYLLDLWIPPNAAVARLRVEVQLKVGQWVVRPMEVRVRPARVPELALSGDAAKLPPLESGADAAAMGPLAGYALGTPLRSYAQPATVRGIIRRNAIQDMALARTLGVSGEEMEQWWLGLAFPRVLGAEWYLRVRDYLFAK